MTKPSPEARRAKRLAERRRRYRQESPEQRAKRLADQKARETRKAEKRAALRAAGLTPQQINQLTIVEREARKAAAKEQKRQRIAAERERKAAERQARAVERAEREALRKTAPEAAARNVLATPAADQPVPECPRERELLEALRLDAILWRSRIAPTMPTDPAQYVHGSGGVDAGAYRNSDGSMVTAFDDGEPEADG